MAPRNSLLTPKPRKNNVRRAIVWSAVAVLVLLVVIAIMPPVNGSDDGGQPEPTVEEVADQVGTASYAEIYQAYKENELVADDLYKGNRYRVTAKINGMTNDGLANMTGGAMLTMETQVGNTIVFFYAEFEREEEEDLKTVKVGDTITYEGTCGSAGYWYDCDLIVE